MDLNNIDLARKNIKELKRIEHLLIYLEKNEISEVTLYPVLKTSDGDGTRTLIKDDAQYIREALISEFKHKINELKNLIRTL